MHENFITHKISYEALRQYFEDYDYEDIVEILEDVKINYQGRRLKLLKNIQLKNGENLEIEPQTIKLESIKKAIKKPILKFSCKNLILNSKLLGDFYIQLKKDVKVFFNFEINEIEKYYQVFLILKVVENKRILFFNVFELSSTTKFLTTCFKRDIVPYFKNKTSLEEKRVYTYLEETFDIIFKIQENSQNFQDFMSNLKKLETF